MVGVVAWPQFVADDCYTLSGVFLDAPSTLERITGKGVEKVGVENAIISINEVSLLLANDGSEMDIVLKLEGSRASEALEALVSSDLVNG